jgi:hypothetical protein
MKIAKSQSVDEGLSNGVSDVIAGLEDGAALTAQAERALAASQRCGT